MEELFADSGGLACGIPCFAESLDRLAFHATLSATTACKAASMENQGRHNNLTIRPPIASGLPAALDDFCQLAYDGILSRFSVLRVLSFQGQHRIIPVVLRPLERRNLCFPHPSQVTEAGEVTQVIGQVQYDGFKPR
jgi:hypothetical protein